MSAFGARREKSPRIDLLPPEPGSRRRGSAMPGRPLEVVDADFVVLPVAAGEKLASSKARRRGLAPAGHAALALRILQLVSAGLLRAMRLAERLLQRLPARAFGAAVAASVTAVFFFAGGLSALATVLGNAESDGRLEIASVYSSLDDRDGMKVLSVYGTVENRSRQTRPVPEIVVDVIAGGTAVASHRIENAATSLPAGATGSFALKIPHNGTTLPKVAVSLASVGASGR